MASLVPDVVDALLSTFRANLTTIQILDGPETVPDDTADLLVVAWTDEDDTVDANQSVATMGTARRRNESITVPCLLRHWTGDNSTADVAAARTAVHNLLDTVETLLRTTPDLGLSQSTSYMVAEITSSKYRCRQVTNGLHAEVIFTVQADCRI